MGLAARPILEAKFFLTPFPSPRKVVGKFSIRTVPSMTGEKVVECVEKHVEKQKEILNSPNKIYLSSARAGIPWYGNPNGFLLG